MSSILKCWLLLAAVSILKAFGKCERDWTYDLVSVEIVNHTPDVLTIDLSVSHPSRGVAAMSGVIDFLEDFQEYSVFYCDIYYSLTGSNFVRSPLHVPKMKLADVMNTFYKDILMKSVSTCCENAPVFENEFIPPITKRTMRLHDCVISTEDMPSKMKSGYYKIIAYATGQAECYIDSIIKVENDNAML